MTIDASFIEKILEVSTTEQLTINEQEYTTKPVHLVKDPMPFPLITHTLESIINYIDTSEYTGENVCIHIESPTEVSLYSHLNLANQRYKYVHSFFEIEQFKFGNFIPVENFIIDLQACFVSSFDLDQILKVVGNLRAETSNTVNDDGFTQNVAVQKSAASIGTEKIPNPVELSPYRTFPEVTQPMSKFICRLKHDERLGFLCGLFPADGDKWKLDAIANIKTWLRNNGIVENHPDITILS